MKKHKPSALLCCCLLLAGCAAQDTAASAAELSDAQPAAEVQTVTFTDDLGREVTVTEQPQRVAALIGSFADVWTLAGGTLVAAANDAWTEFDLDLGEDVVNLGKTSEVSLEQLLECEPDFVIASCNTDIDLEFEASLEEIGIPVAYFQVSTFEEYLSMLERCTEVTNRPDLYQTNGTDIQAQVDNALAQADGSAPTVLYLRASQSSVKVKGKGSVLGEMLNDFGCINIADRDESLLENLSMEAIMEQDPEKIFVVLQGEDTESIRANLAATLTDDPAWSSLTAVQNGQVYEMDQRLFNLKPNNRWGEAYQQLADILFPAE